MRWWRLVLVALLVAGCRPPPELNLESDEAVAYVNESPFALRVETDWLVLEQDAPIVFVDADGGRAELLDLVDWTSERQPDGSYAYGVETSTGDEVWVYLRWRTPTTLSVSIWTQGGVAAVEDGWKLADGELVYGLTERLRDSDVIAPAINGPMIEDMVPVEAGSLDARGQVVDMFVHPTFSLYAPLVHGSRGWGLWVENDTPGTWDVGATDPDVLRFSIEAPSVEGWPWSLEYDLLLGPSHGEILQGYFELTGDPFRMPDWAFEHWRWRDELTRGLEPVELDGVPVHAQVAEDILAYEEHDIPFGVYMFDRPVLVGGTDPDSQGWSEFRWDEERLPNTEAMLESLRDRDMPIAMWAASWARGLGEGTLWHHAAEAGYLAPGSDRVIDWTNPEAVSWWEEALTPFLAEHGIQGIKLDRGEEFIPNEVTDVWADGRHGREMHNAFQTLQSRVFHDLLDEAFDGDFVLMPRSGWSGSQRYAVHWGGDAAGDSELGLRAEIIKLQRAGFLGFATWGSDTGGYEQFEDREVFARWLQFSALCPIMEIGGRGSHAPWDMPTEPAYDEEMIAIYRRYVQLHHDLGPYFAVQADAVASTGRPIARAMVFDYPDDPALLDRWDQFMTGPDLLVAPIWRSGQREREVALPAGEWEWAWDRSQAWTGPATVTVEAELDVLPLFVRAGALTDVL